MGVAIPFSYRQQQQEALAPQTNGTALYRESDLFFFLIFLRTVTRKVQKVSGLGMRKVG